jgi:hypothetical protein
MRVLPHPASPRQIIPIPAWPSAPRAARELLPEDWDSRNLAEKHEPVYGGETLDPFWWQALRDRALAQESR